MAIVKTTAETCVGRDLEKLELSYIAGGNVKWCSRFGKQSLRQFLKRLNTQSPRSSTTRHVRKNNEACPHMFTKASFIITKKWKQCEYASTDEWINKCGLSI